jgi:murein DD-endopeptidase MepM/ murein hydrolase activator NlpD
MTGAASTSRRRLAVAALLVTAACAREASAASDPEPRAPVTTTTEAPTTTTTTAPPTTTTTVPPTTTTTVPPTDGTHPARVVLAQPWVPYATVGPLTLHHPSDRVEAIGFHQSGNDGALAQVALPTSVRWFTQASRGRDTDPQGAADIVVEPGREIRSPVTGTVVRVGTYALYCDDVDELVIIEPDDRPGWQVKVLHIEGVTLVAGQRVQAGVTRLADHARVLPFPSQVEDDTGQPAWPHVHVEVVDPAIPDRPSGPGCPP